MRILISAFDCNPNIGSDSYVGWHFCNHMARLNEVVVLTDAVNKESIERFYINNAKPNIEFVFVKKPIFIRRALSKINTQVGVLAAYYLWQKSALKEAKRICRVKKFDICHHISIADFRIPGYLWKLKNVSFIFGPVGGGQEVPLCLNKYVEGHEKVEKLRSFLNRFMTALPNYKNAMKKAAVIYSSNDETTTFIEHLNNSNKGKIVQLTELEVEENEIEKNMWRDKKVNDKVHIVVAGRLIYRKGISLLLDVISSINTEHSFCLDVYGEGDERNELEQKAAALNISDKVTFHGNVSLAEMPIVYANADIFCLPSLRETTGTAVFEAMSYGLPVVALRQNGVKNIVENDAGILIDIKSKDQVIADYAIALRKLIESLELRMDLGQKGREKLRNFTWEKRVSYFNKVYMDLCGKNKQGEK